MTLSLNKNPASTYPHDLLSNHLPDEPWWVAHTKSRQEKALAHYLGSAGVNYFLPLLKKPQASANRLRYSVIPMFTGYLFFKGDLLSRQEAYRSHNVAKVIEVSDQDILTKELQNIQKVMNGDLPIYQNVLLKKGKRVRVKSGPLEGLEGTIIRKKRKSRLILEVTMISQAVAVDVELALVETI